MEDYGAMIRSAFELGSVRDARVLFEACIMTPGFVRYMETKC